jgi:hypothetical protein
MDPLKGWERTDTGGYTRTLDSRWIVGVRREFLWQPPGVLGMSTSKSTLCLRLDSGPWIGLGSRSLHSAFDEAWGEEWFREAQEDWEEHLRNQGSFVVSDHQYLSQGENGTYTIYLPSEDGGVVRNRNNVIVAHFLWDPRKKKMLYFVPPLGGGTRVPEGLEKFVTDLLQRRQIMYQDGKVHRIPGAFQERRKVLRARQKRHDRILLAAKLAETGDSWLNLDGFALKLTQDPTKALSRGEHFVAVVRTKSFGLRIGDVCTKDWGWVHIVGQGYPTIGLSKNLVVAYISEVYRNGVQQTWV